MADETKKDEDGLDELDGIMLLLTGMSFKEAMNIGVKEGSQAMVDKTLESARKQRAKDNLMNPANMFKRPGGSDET